MLKKLIEKYINGYFKSIDMDEDNFLKLLSILDEKNISYSVKKDGIFIYNKNFPKNSLKDLIERINNDMSEM